MIQEDQLKLGNSIRVAKYRGKEEKFAGKVVGLRDIHSLLVSRNTRKSNRITRSQYLVTLQDNDGKTKSFYSAFLEGENEFQDSRS